MDLAYINAGARTGTRRTYHWSVKFIEISPILSFWRHNINFFVYEWSHIPNRGQSLFGIGAQGTVGSSEKSDTASMLQQPMSWAHFAASVSNRDGNRTYPQCPKL